MAANKKILVVDDEPDIVTYLSTLFADQGYEVVTAADGEGAVRTARAEKPDLITLDMSMPGQSGVRALAELKADDVLKKIPVIIVTGIGEPMKSFLDRMKKAPTAEGFISKPIEEAELLGLAKKLTA